MQLMSLMKQGIVPLFLIGFGHIESAAAASLYMVPQNSSITIPDQAIYELWMDFSGDPTIGGGVNVLYDNFTDGNQLSLVSYTPNLGNPDLGYGDPLLGLAGDPDLTSAPYPDTNGWSTTGWGTYEDGSARTMLATPTPTPSGLMGISFGDTTLGLEGPSLVGTLVFNTLLAGTYTTSVEENADSGGFWVFSSGAPQQQTPYYNFNANGTTPITASITVDSAVVPVPAAVWLMASGLAGMLLPRSRRRR